MAPWIIFPRSDAAATIYFIVSLPAGTIRRRLQFEGGYYTSRARTHARLIKRLLHQHTSRVRKYVAVYHIWKVKNVICQITCTCTHEVSSHHQEPTQVPLHLRLQMRMGPRCRIVTGKLACCRGNSWSGICYTAILQAVDFVIFRAIDADGDATFTACHE